MKLKAEENLILHHTMLTIVLGNNTFFNYTFNRKSKEMTSVIAIKREYIYLTIALAAPTLTV